MLSPPLSLLSLPPSLPLTLSVLSLSHSLFLFSYNHHCRQKSSWIMYFLIFVIFPNTPTVIHTTLFTETEREWVNVLCLWSPQRTVCAYRVTAMPVPTWMYTPVLFGDYLVKKCIRMLCRNSGELCWNINRLCRALPNTFRIHTHSWWCYFF